MKLIDYKNELKICSENPFIYFVNNPIKTLKVALHPDKWIGEEEVAKELFIEFNKLFETTQNKITFGKYTVVSQINRGDIANIYKCLSDTGKLVVVKSSFIKAPTLLTKEVSIIKELRGDKIYDQFLPTILEKFDNNIVYSYDENLISGLEITHTMPNIDGRHLIWMFKRILMILGYIHRKDYVHGAITPDHLLFKRDNHGLILCDWIHAGKINTNINLVPAKWKHFYPKEAIDTKLLNPKLDIYMAALTMLEIGGKNINKTIENFFKSLILPYRMIPNDPWELHEEVNFLAKNLYGNSTFIPL
jgi:serine/threonine protein kinase